MNAVIEEKKSAAGGCQLVPVGYHQVYYDWESQRRSWRFRPSKVMNDTGCQPYPFVLGDVTGDVEWLVICEGQWDIATFWGAAGLFEEYSPLGECIVGMGLRGSKSDEVFLAAWSDWLVAKDPKVWLLLDNDGPGRELGERLAARLRSLGLDRVTASTFGEYKDFNDAYRAMPAAFGPEQLAEVMEGLF